MRSINGVGFVPQFPFEGTKHKLAYRNVVQDCLDYKHLGFEVYYQSMTSVFHTGADVTPTEPYLPVKATVSGFIGYLTMLTHSETCTV